MRQRTKEEIEDWLKSKQFNSREDLERFLKSTSNISSYEYHQLEGDLAYSKADILWEKWGKEDINSEEVSNELTQTNDLIKQEFDTLRDFVIQKNITYGNSLQNPLGIFQKEPLQGILGRIDDKLSRIKTVGINDETEDTLGDLIGYLVHLKIMIKK